MKVLTLSEAKAKLSEIVDRRNEPVAITRNGRAIAVILSTDEYEGLHETIRILPNPQFMKEVRDGIRDLNRTGSLTP